MALVVAAAVADSQVFDMAAAAFAQRLNVFQRSVTRQHMLATHPARHHAMHLTRNRFINFVSREA